MKDRKEKLTFKNQNIIFKLKTRGLCCVLSSIHGLLEERLLGSKKTVYVDSTGSHYFKIVNFYDVFETNKILTDSVIGDEKKVVEGAAACRFGKRAYKSKIKSILNYTPEFHKEINAIISKLKLPESFSCFHIRRGDKVGEKYSTWTEKTGNTEAKRWEFCDYLKQCEDIKTIFIMSDDFQSVREAHEYINDNNLPHKILYLTNESQNGRSESLEVINNYKYTRQELVQFFAEIEIAKRSDVFVGTRSSNVYRYIMNTCTTNTEFISLDT